MPTGGSSRGGEGPLPREPREGTAILEACLRAAQAPPRVRCLIYERAVKELPGSYKIWYAYLKERMNAVSDLCITDSKYEEANSAFDRALVFLHKMPRIWRGTR
ncbi:unnamed protein product [Prorocentrum cordatum]|uniref:Pre-mRNA-splicing factor Syf1-like N-terminal HAT-repeats domain-containing protein n=1 Tax=Prorocentrum cordatum TaxID=2364126 RepID=A0ABN9TE89_9DINO|nr:unnamed protein product [Polarella glacialis]